MANRAETKKRLTPPSGSITGGAAVPEVSTPQCLTSDSLPESEEIARLAYSYYEARGYQGGSPEEDWFRAEQQLKSEPTASKR